MYESVGELLDVLDNLAEELYVGLVELVFEEYSVALCVRL